MNSMNKFITIGRLTKDPEIKELENGNKVSNITLPVDRPYKDKEGNKITDFLSYSLWNKDAERLCKLSSKGALISLEGYNTMKDVEFDGHKTKVISPVVTNYNHLTNAKTYSDDVPENTVEEKAMA